MKELIEIQSQLKVPKGNINKFGNYKYRSSEDILESVKPLLKKNNATLTLTDEIINIGIKYFIKSTAKFSVNEILIKTEGAGLLVVVCS